MSDLESEPLLGPNEAAEWLRAHGFTPDDGSSRWNRSDGAIGRIIDRTVVLGTEPKVWRGLRWFATVTP